jgi:hypothetical protein
VSYELRASDLIRFAEPAGNAKRDGGSVTSQALRCQLGQRRTRHDSAEHDLFAFGGKPQAIDSTAESSDL